MHINVFPELSMYRLRKERRKLYGSRAAAMELLAGNRNAEDKARYQSKFNDIQIRLGQVESALLLKEAHYLGIDYPTKDEKPDWWTTDAEPWLSEKGQIRINKLCKEEKRKNLEWWVKIISPLLAALISLLGLLIALLTILHTLGKI